MVNRPLLVLRRASLVAQTVMRLSAMQETWVRSLGWEDPLEKEMASHSSILAWKIPWMEEPGGLQSMESQSWTQLMTSLSYINIYLIYIYNVQKYLLYFLSKGNRTF